MLNLQNFFWMMRQLPWNGPIMTCPPSVPYFYADKPRFCASIFRVKWGVRLIHGCKDRHPKTRTLKQPPWAIIGMESAAWNESECQAIKINWKSCFLCHSYSCESYSRLSTEFMPMLVTLVGFTHPASERNQTTLYVWSAIASRLDCIVAVVILFRKTRQNSLITYRTV